MARGKGSSTPTIRPPWRRDGSSSEQPRWQRWLIVGIALFLVIDVVVIAIALAQNRAPIDESTSRPIPTFSNVPSTPGGAGTGSTGAPTPGSSGAPGADAGATEATLPVTRFLAAESATAAWRATQGSCATGTGAAAQPATPAVIERTTDGGTTWTNVSTGAADVRQVFRFASLGASAAAVVGATGDDCDPAAFRTFSGGSTWAANASELAAARYIDPAEPTVVQTSAGPVTPPCPNPRQVIAGTTNLTVLCAGQLLVQAADASWSSASVPGALAATSTAQGLTLASVGVADCAGISIGTLPLDVSGATVTPVGCLDAETSPSSVALSEVGGTLWLWSNTASYVSPDAGATW